MKIFLIGGGTGGAAAPVLAVAQSLARIRGDIKFFYLSTKQSLDDKFVHGSTVALTSLSIPAGKWRRYFSLRNFSDIFKTVFGFFKSIYLLKKHKPDIIFGAGSFVQVPVVWAAYLMGVPTVVHQQDFDLLLSTKLTTPFAKFVTTSFDASLKELPAFSGLFKKVQKGKFLWTGNPVRQEILDGSKQRATELFGLRQNFPTVLAIGGSMGSQRLNREIVSALPELLKYVQIIHVTGDCMSGQKDFNHAHYHTYNFLGEELKHAYAAADIVLSRAGMSTITELAALGKPAIVVPLPHSPQEDNAKLLGYMDCAAVIFEESLNPETLISTLRKILWNPNALKTMQHNIQMLMPKDATVRIAELLLKIYDERKKNQ